MKLFELQSTAEVTELEKQLDKMFASLGIDVEFTRHFIERILGRERSVSVEDIVRSFDQLKRKYKARLLKAKKTPNYSAVLRDFDQDLNIVFGIKPGKDGAELVNITIKKKDPSTFVTTAAGGEDLKVGSQRSVNEDDIPAMGTDASVSPEMDEQRLNNDEKNNKRDKILKVGRGKNHKTAARIASMARTNAKAADKEMSSDNPNQSSHGGYSPNNFRLVT